MGKLREDQISALSESCKDISHIFGYHQPTERSLGYFRIVSIWEALHKEEINKIIDIAIHSETRFQILSSVTYSSDMKKRGIVIRFYP